MFSRLGLTSGRIPEGPIPNINVEYGRTLFTMKIFQSVVGRYIKQELVDTQNWHDLK